jgi:hypothetical protein
LSQVVIATDAIRDNAVEAKNGFAVLEIDFVFQAALARRASGIKIFDSNAEIFEFGKLFRKIG